MSHAASQQTGWNLKHTAGIKEVNCACPSLFLTDWERDSANKSAAKLVQRLNT
jgi:hypothetical protein